MPTTTIKATGGGRFHRNSPNKFFFAVNREWWMNYARPSGHRNILIPVNEVVRGTVDSILPTEDILLDSGVFGLATNHAKAHGCHVSSVFALSPEEVDGFAELESRYKAIIRQYEDQLWGYIELDLGPIAVKKARREALEAEGIRPIPVYSVVGDSWDYFVELAETYDRIAIGSIARIHKAQKEPILAAVCEHLNSMENPPWTHFLGCTPGLVVNTFNCQSVDSTSWQRRGRFGIYSLFCMTIQGTIGNPQIRPPLSFVKYEGEQNRPPEVIKALRQAEALQYSAYAQALATHRQDVLQALNPR